MTSKTIVVLANSFKHKQHCVAGKCIVTKEWVRPVADVNGSALSHEQAKCENPSGKFNVKPKQKVIIGLDTPAPLPNQPENHIVDNSVWQWKSSIRDDELNHYLDAPENLWGTEDRVAYPLIECGNILIHQSLYLVHVDNLSLYKNRYGKKRASFNYNGLDYDLAVTDPEFENLVSSGQEPSGILCISLGEVFNGDCYKLVATIF